MEDPLPAVWSSLRQRSSVALVTQSVLAGTEHLTFISVAKSLPFLVRSGIDMESS